MPTPAASRPCCGSYPSGSRRGPGFTRTRNNGCWVDFATGTGRTDAYSARTALAPLLGLGYDVRRDDTDFAAIRRLVEEWREVAPNYYGDFYPLTPWTYAIDTWMAWQFDRPEAGRGVIQAFR